MFKFKRLEVANKLNVPKFEVKNEGDTASIYVYDAIGSYFGIEAKQFVNDLNSIKAPNISLHINSPGGDVFEAKAIASAIKQHPAKVTAYIDGLAASAATTIALAADEVVMAEGAFFMIHNAWSLAIGDGAEMRKVADMLDKISDSIANEYVAKTGASKDQVNSWMNAETWFNAEEAKAQGFIDSVQTGSKASNLWDLTGYDNAPKIENKSDEPDFDIEHLQRRMKMLERIG